MAASAATRVLNTIGALLPDRVWRAPPVLALMGPAAGMALRAGRVAMAGRAPNGQAFVANPKWIWLIAKSSAQLDGQQFGPPGPARPDRLVTETSGSPSEESSPSAAPSSAIPRPNLPSLIMAQREPDNRRGYDTPPNGHFHAFVIGDLSPMTTRSALQPVT